MPVGTYGISEGLLNPSSLLKSVMEFEQRPEPECRIDLAALLGHGTEFHVPVHPSAITAKNQALPTRGHGGSTILNGVVSEKRRTSQSSGYLVTEK